MALTAIRGKAADVPEAQRLGRTVKKRSTRACQSCRLRKVKCSLIESGIPCRRCETSNTDCLVVEAKPKGRYGRLREELDPRGVSSGKDHVLKQVTQPYTPPNHSMPSPLVLSPDNYTSSESSMAWETSYRPSAKLVLLPPFIQPARPGFRPEDLDLLDLRDALSVPQEELRNHLLYCFVLYVFPYMPIIDVEGFFDALGGKQGAPKLSLILFQAVMFAGTAYVDLELLLDAGYRSRIEAREQCYRKIKLLYDLDWEIDRVALTQALLLANHWYVCENDQKDPWHWLGICISVASSIGINRAAVYERQPIKVRRLWRRIWWTCVMRDCTMALDMRRPLQIREDDSDLARLSMDDFDVELTHSSLSIVEDCSFMRSTDMRHNLARLCMAHIDILLHGASIIRSLYYVAVFDGFDHGVKVLYKPRWVPFDGEKASTLQDQLDQWYRTLPLDCRLDSVSSTAHPYNTAERVLFVHKSVLWMTYLMAVLHLDRPRMLAQHVVPSSAVSQGQEAAKSISIMFSRLEGGNLVCLLPPISVGFLLYAIPTLLSDNAPVGEETPDPLAEHLSCCGRALRRLRQIWPIADYVHFMVCQMLSKGQSLGKLGSHYHATLATKSVRRGHDRAEQLMESYQRSPISTCNHGTLQTRPNDNEGGHAVGYSLAILTPPNNATGTKLDGHMAITIPTTPEPDRECVHLDWMDLICDYQFADVSYGDEDHSHEAQHDVMDLWMT